MTINDCFKIRNLILTAALVVSLGFINHASALPDFIAPDITGPTTIIRNSEGATTIPLRVVVGNQGPDNARLYGKNEIVYRYESGTAFMAPFRTPFETNVQFFSRKSWIDPGTRVTLNGTVNVPSPRLNEIFSLSVIVDWCKDPRLMEGCSVRESNEYNNQSEQISMYICTPGPLPPINKIQDISDLGPLPRGMTVTWPTPPSIPSGSDVSIRSANFQNEYVNRLNKSGTRFRFQENITEAIVVPENTSDVEIIIDPGVKLHSIELRPSVHRVKISGCERSDGCEITGRGEVGRIRVSIYDPIETNEDSGYITDVLIDGITLNNSQEDPLCQTDGNDCDGVTFRGVRRGTVINSTISSLVYPIAAWNPLSPPPITAQNKDIIVANNRLHSKGYTRDSIPDPIRVSEATVRMHDSVNTVTMHNRLQNGDLDSARGKHNYRIHGHPSKGGASYAYAACNLFVNTGVMIGEGGYDPAPPREDVRHYWFNSNLFYQRADSLYQMGLTPDVAVHDAEIRGNRAYSDLHTHFYSPDSPPADWIIRDNPVVPYGTGIRPPD